LGSCQSQIEARAGTEIFFETGKGERQGQAKAGVVEARRSNQIRLGILPPSFGGVAVSQAEAGLNF